MSLGDLLLSVLSLRSFTNVWYWIAVFGFWIWVCLRPLGVPADILLRARLGDESALQDLRAFVQLQINRIAYLVDVQGVWAVGLACFAGTMLAVLGWAFKIEIARAGMFIYLPAIAVGGLTLMRARRIFQRDLMTMPPKALLGELLAHRFWCRSMAFVMILGTFFMALVDIFYNRPF